MLENLNEEQRINYFNNLEIIGPDDVNKLFENLNNKLNLHIDEINLNDIKEYLLTVIKIKYMKDKKLNVKNLISNLFIFFTPL